MPSSIDLSGRGERAAALPGEIRHALRRFGARHLRLRAGWRLGVTAAACAVLLGGSLVLDRFLILEESVRVAVTCVAAGGALLLAVWSLAGLLRPTSWLRLARGLEAEDRRFAEGLITLVERRLSGPGGARNSSSSLDEALRQAVAVRLSGLRIGSLLDARRSKLALAMAAAAWTVGLAWAASDRESAKMLLARFAHPTSDLPRPSTVILEVAPGSTRIALGDDAEIRVRLTRGNPRDASLHTRTGENPWAVEARAFEGGGFVRRFVALRRPVEYRVIAGDFASPVFRIDVREPPAARSFRVAYEPPAYTGLPPRNATGTTGDLVALAGSSASVEITASEPLARSWIEWADGGAAVPLEIDGSTARWKRVEIGKSDGYRLHLESAEGVTNGGRERYSIRALPDKPPALEILDPRTPEVLVEDTSLLELRFDARDDVGVTSIQLVVKAESDGEKEARAFPIDPAARQHSLDIASLGLRAGESANVLLRARDALGQEAESAGRILRVSLAAPPPEGPEWPRPLADVEQALAAALDDWTKLLPTPGGEPPETLAAEPAAAERLLDAAEKSLGVIEFIRRTGGAAVEAGRAIAIPSPNRDALEGLGRALRRAADTECAGFWREATAAAGSIQASVAGAREPVPSARLFESHRAAGSSLEGALADSRVIERAERIEEALERCLGIERLEARARSSPSLRKGLAADAISIAAELTKLSAGSQPNGDALESIARTLLDSAVPALEKGEESAAGILAGARARLEERYEKDEKAAAAARARLEPRSAAESAIERLAAAATRADALGAARTATLELAEDRELVESLEYADLDASADLAALEDVVEVVAEEPWVDRPEPAGGAAEPTAAVALLHAYRATEPSRIVGRAVQRIDRIAAAQEDLGWKLRASSVWSWKTLRLLSRTEREHGRALVLARDALSRLVGAPSAPAAGLQAGLASAVQAIDAAGGTMKESREALQTAMSGGPAGESARTSAIEAAGRASSALDDVVKNLEELRASAMPEAAEARAWLRAQLGAVPERIARQAAAERAHSASVRTLSATGASADARAGAAALLLAHEEIRRETGSLAIKTRREGDRLVAAGADVARLRAHDAAALRLASISSGEMAEASRSLRAASSADASSRAGALLDVAVKEEAIAGQLDAMARALAAIDADEALRASLKDVEDAFRSTPRSDVSAATSQDPEKIAKDARLLLDASKKASATLASRLARDPGKAPLLDLLRVASQDFLRAIELAARKETPAAAAALEAGRARLEEAVVLARKLRGESEGDLASALRSLEPATKDEQKPEISKEASRELEAAYAELEKLLEAERLEREIAQQMRELLGEAKPDPAKLEELERKERDLEQGLGEKYLTSAELVELVSKLVSIDRDARDVAGEERSIAADAARAIADSAQAPPDLASLEPRQAAAIQNARKAATSFRASGFKLSAVLPNVLRAWWKAGDALEPSLAAMDGAAMEIASRTTPERSLLDAAAKLDSFLSAVGDMRRQALEAIADLERGGDSPNAAQAGLERARRSLNEAARLRREGKSEAAIRSQQSSLHSIADAAGAMRSRIERLALPSGDEGALMSRVLDEEAARLGLGWQVLTRGSSQGSAARMAEPGAGDMPYPARFREWVRVYLRAIER